MTGAVDSRLTVAFYLLLVGWSLALIRWALGWPSWRSHLFPLLVTGPLALLAVIQLASLRAPERLASLARPSGDGFGLLDSLPDDVADGPREPTAGDETDPTRLAVILLWVVALPVAVHYVGFLLATPAFLFGFVGYLRDDWWLAAKVSALVTVVLITFLVYLLQAQLFGGVLDPLGAIPV